MEFPKDKDEASFRSLREYSRADGHLPIDIRVVSEEERPLLRSHTSLETALTEHAEMPEPSDRVLAECIRILNAKMDSIIRMLAFQTKDYCSLQIEEVNISAGGLSTNTSGDFKSGDMVEIRLMLPTTPYTIFYIYGNVVKVEKIAEGRRRISVEFILIDEDIREQIVKYVFERQREILRKKRGL